MTSQRILVTGGAGFIGSRLSLKLVERGHRVRVLDCLSPQIHGADPDRSPLYRSILGKVEFHRGDVTSREDLERALDGMDTVVHYAAETGTGQSMYAIRHYTDANVGGTSLLLDLIANRPYPIRKLVVASSRAVYGEGAYTCPEHGKVYPKARSLEDMQGGDFGVRCPVCGAWSDLIATDEDAPVNPSSVYGITKLSQEQLVLTVGRALGISAIAFRYQNVYGPGQSLSNPYTGILSIFTNRIRAGRGLNIFEDGQESRDFVYVDDVVDATLAGIETENTLTGVFNVGSGVPTTVLAIAEKLQSLLGQQVPTEISGQFRVGDIRHNVADLARIQAALSFSPKVSLDMGLENFVKWATSQGPEPDRYEQSLEELRAKGLFKG